MVNWKPTIYILTYEYINVRKSDMHTAQLKAVTMKLKINISPVSEKRNVGVDVLSIQDLLLVNAIYLLRVLDNIMQDSACAFFLSDFFR